MAIELHDQQVERELVYGASMRLSDAIAMGRTLLVPCGGKPIYGNGSGCALGMAGVAVGLLKVGLPTSTTTAAERMVKYWPWMQEGFYELPCKCGCIGPLRLHMVIVHMFDEHVSNCDWTLDQLIDWVRSVEPPELEETADGGSAEVCTIEMRGALP